MNQIIPIITPIPMSSRGGSITGQELGIIIMVIVLWGCGMMGFFALGLFLADKFGIDDMACSYGAMLFYIFLTGLSLYLFF